MRLSAMEHATGDWDSFFTQNQWNMYCYKPTMGKWTALKWDWNITLGGGTQTWGPDASELFDVGSNDPIMGDFQNYTPYRRAYLRALQDIANLAMNNAVVNPMLEAKYAAFVANGLTNAAYGLVVQDPAKPGGLEQWIGTMHNSLVDDLDEPRREQRPVRDQFDGRQQRCGPGERNGAPGREDPPVQRRRVADNVDQCHGLDRRRAVAARRQPTQRGRCGSEWPAGGGRQWRRGRGQRRNPCCRLARL